MEDSIPGQNGEKVIVLTSHVSGILKEPPVEPLNRISYQVTKEYLHMNFIDNPLFLTNHFPPWRIQEYGKRYFDGNKGSEFVIKCTWSSSVVRKIENEFIVTTSDIGNAGFSGDFENFALDSEDEGFYGENLDLVFIDYGKRLKYVIEELWESVEPYYSNESVIEKPKSFELIDYYDSLRHQDILDYKLFTQNKKISDLDCFKRWDSSFTADVAFIRGLSKHFELPSMNLKGGFASLPINPEYKKIAYKNKNFWISDSGVSSFEYSLVEKGKDIEENIFIFPTLRDFFAWEYLGIKNRKRCRICGRILPADYKGKYCSEELDPECRKKMERMKKQGTLPE